jgi:hypothetical protein
MRMDSVRALTLLASVAAALLVGCGSNVGASPKGVSHVGAISALYFKATSVLGRNPADEQEFKTAIGQGPMDLDVLGVSSVDELFVSDRDGQPLVILYGPQPKNSRGVIAYEQTGKDGVKLVGTSNGQVIEADATQFAKLVPPSAPQ